VRGERHYENIQVNSEEEGKGTQPNAGLKSSNKRRKRKKKAGPMARRCLQTDAMR